jgi:hypothetical protein
MMARRHSDLEHALRQNIRAAFAGSKIYCRRDRRGFCARIDLPSGTWCSTRGTSRAGAVANCFELAQEPAPGFPGWVEPTPSRVVDANAGELALT